MPKNRTAVLFMDIDGVLADCTHRLHHIQNGHNDYDTFYAEVGGDTPIADPEFIEEIKDKYSGDIVFVTGRDENCRKDTVEWLDKYFQSGDKDLLMRPHGSRAPAPEVKSELVVEWALNHKDVDTYMVIDDNPKNVQEMVDTLNDLSHVNRVMGAVVKNVEVDEDEDE